MFRVSPAPCRWRCTPRCSPQVETLWLCASRCCRSRSGCWDFWHRSCWCGACAATWATDMLQVSVLRQRPGFSLQADFAAATPGVIALFGRSGSGKTTLVNLISGLLTPDSGRICIGDEVLTDTRAGIAVPVERRRIGYVFQEPRLFPHLTVAGNLRYGERRAGAAPRIIGFEEVV